MTTETKNIDTARRYLRAIEDGVAFEDLASFFTPDIVQHEYPNQFVPQGTQRGIQQLRQAAERGRRVVTSQRYEVCNFVASGDWVALEATWIAVVAVPVGAIPAGGEMRANFGYSRSSAREESHGRTTMTASIRSNSGRC